SAAAATGRSGSGGGGGGGGDGGGGSCSGSNDSGGNNGTDGTCDDGVSATAAAAPAGSAAAFGWSRRIRLIVDVGGARLSGLEDAALLAALGRCLRALRDHYPGMLHTATVVDVPPLFELVWAGLVPLLAPETAAKIEVFSDPATWRAALTKAIDPAFLPERYGGNGPDVLAPTAAPSPPPPEPALALPAAGVSATSAVSHFESGRRKDASAATAMAAALMAVAARWLLLSALSGSILALTGAVATATVLGRGSVRGGDGRSGVAMDGRVNHGKGISPDFYLSPMLFSWACGGRPPTTVFVLPAAAAAASTEELRRLLWQALTAGLPRRGGTVPLLHDGLAAYRHVLLPGMLAEEPTSSVVTEVFPRESPEAASQLRLAAARLAAVVFSPRDARHQRWSSNGRGGDVGGRSSGGGARLRLGSAEDALAVGISSPPMRLPAADRTGKRRRASESPGRNGSDPLAGSVAAAHAEERGRRIPNDTSTGCATVLSEAGSEDNDSPEALVASAAEMVRAAEASGPHLRTPTLQGASVHVRHVLGPRRTVIFAIRVDAANGERWSIARGLNDFHVFRQRVTEAGGAGALAAAEAAAADGQVWEVPPRLPPLHMAQGLEKQLAGVLVVAADSAELHRFLGNVLPPEETSPPPPFRRPSSHRRAAAGRSWGSSGSAVGDSSGRNLGSGVGGGIGDGNGDGEGSGSSGADTDGDGEGRSPPAVGFSGRDRAGSAGAVDVHAGNGSSGGAGDSSGRVGGVYNNGAGISRGGNDLGCGSSGGAGGTGRTSGGVRELQGVRPELAGVVLDSGGTGAFKLRGASYFQDKRKTTAAAAACRLLHVDLFSASADSTDNGAGAGGGSGGGGSSGKGGGSGGSGRLDHVCAHGKAATRLRKLALRESAAGRPELFFFVVNLQLPKAVERGHLSFVCYFGVPVADEDSTPGGRRLRDAIRRYVSMPIHACLDPAALPAAAAAPAAGDGGSSA
ncbi:unnamed protein product, partial [Phaeothamnion confervicola]